MKKSFIIIGITAAAFFLFSCKKEITKVYPSFLSYFSYSLSLQGSINANTVKPATFGPNGACLNGGKIYIANRSANRVEILDAGTRTLRDSITKWTFNGVAEKLNQPVDVFVSNGRIYVCCFGSYRIDVFNQQTLAFISCIGIGQYYGTNAILDPWAVRVLGNKVFVKTREAYIDVFDDNDITPANYKNVKIKAYLTLQNSGFDNSTYSMECNGKNLYVTDRNSKQIMVYNTDQADLTNTQLAQKANAIAPISQIALANQSATPTGLSFYKDSLMLVSYDNNPSIDVLRKGTNTVVASLQKVNGINFKTPYRIFTKNDTLLVSDNGVNFVYMTTIQQSEIRQYK